MNYKKQRFKPILDKKGKARGLDECRFPRNLSVQTGTVSGNGTLMQWIWNRFNGRKYPSYSQGSLNHEYCYYSVICRLNIYFTIDNIFILDVHIMLQIITLNVLDNY